MRGGGSAEAAGWLGYRPLPRRTGRRGHTRQGAVIDLFLQRCIDGLANGSLYGALAVALVVVYKASGRLNLAQGEQATLGTYFSLVLSSPATPALAGTTLAARWLPGTPWKLGVAIAGAMVLSAVIAALIERLIVRRIPERLARSSVSVTIGLLLLLNALTTYEWKPVGRGYRSPFPNAPSDYVHIAGARLRYTTVGTWATFLVVLGALWLVLRFTRAGLAFRAVSSTRTNSELMGIHAGRVLTGGWALAGALGTLAGCLLASQLVLSPDMMVRLLVFGFAAATIGGLSSLGGALVGGLLVGVSQTMLGGYVGFIKGPLSLPTVLLLMVVMLAFRPHGLFGRRGTDRSFEDPLDVVALPTERRPLFVLRRRSPAWRALAVVLGVVALVVVVVPPFLLPFIEANLWTRTVATTVVLWGLGLLMGPAGQLSLGHGAFVGLGGYATAVVITRYDWPAYVGIGLCALVGFFIGCVLGLPAIRIKGQYLAMVTLSFAVAFPMVIQRFSWFTGGSSGPPAGSNVRAPSWFPAGEDQAWLHLLVTALALVVLFLLMNLLHSRVGRAIRATAQGDVAATAMGVNVVRTRTVVFGLAAALAAVGGGLLALNDRVVTTEQFDLFRSLALYTAIVFGGAELLSGALIGAVLLIAVPYVNAREGWKISPNLIFGLLVLAGTALFPDGVAPRLARLLRRVVRVVDDTGG
jgi:branched-subunit amino acid ABC-type transport system permease component